MSDQLQLFDRLDGDLDRTARSVMRWLRREYPTGLAIRPGSHHLHDLPGTREQLLAVLAMLADLGLVRVREHRAGRRR
jgi:hypothetical protein